MIQIIADNREILIEWVEFSDGASTCKLDLGENLSFKVMNITVSPRTPCDLVVTKLSLILNALHQLNCSTDMLKLHLPYLPYARADRVFEQGNPIPLHNFLHLVDVLGFDEVTCYDIHNKVVVDKIVVEGSLDFNLTEVDQVNCFQYACKRYNGYAQKWDYIIAPDKGAKDKAKSIADLLGVSVVQASKERDISTGRIIKTELDTTLPVGSRVIICDDILDGGGTFIPLAEELRSQGCTVDLYVTHLIAAKGLDIFKGLIDNIYCYQTVSNYVNRQDVFIFNRQ